MIFRDAEDLLCTEWIQEPFDMLITIIEVLLRLLQLLFSTNADMESPNSVL